MTYHERRSSLRVDRLALRHRHRAVGTAMVRALHADNILLPCDRPSHLDGTFDCLRTTVPEEERIKRFVGHHREELLDETEVRLVESNTALCRARY